MVKYFLFFAFLSVVVHLAIHIYYRSRMKRLLEEIEDLYQVRMENEVSQIKKIKVEIDYNSHSTTQHADIILLENNLIILPISANMRQPSLQMPANDRAIPLSKVNYTHFIYKIRIYHHEIDLYSYHHGPPRFLHATFSFDFSTPERMKLVVEHIQKYYAEFIS